METKKLLLMASGMIFFLLTGCSGRKTNPLVLPTIKLNDYTFETTPNDLDNVGYVFAVDRSQVQIPVTLLKLDSKEGSIAIESNSRTRDVTVSSLFNFLGLKKSQLSASAGVTANSKLTTTFKLENPLINRVYLMTLDTVIAQNINAITKVLKAQNLEDADLYIVSETIKSKKLTYEFGKTRTGQVNLSADFQKIGSTADSLKWNNANGGSLTYTMPKDLIVFYKVYKLLKLHGIGGDVIKTGDAITSPESLFTSRK